MVLATTDVAAALGTIAESRPDLVVVDSIQALAVDPAGAGGTRCSTGHSAARC
jgi:predicted ATP-dependent serine protease